MTWWSIRGEGSHTDRYASREIALGIVPRIRLWCGGTHEDVVMRSCRKYACDVV